MSTRQDDPDDADDGPGRLDRRALRTRFREEDGRIVECTIHPREVSDEELMTTWISADRSSFVDLSAVR